MLNYSIVSARLTNAEDLVYRRLLDEYALSEHPLPDDIDMLGFLIRMKDSKDEIEFILSNFFVLLADGWNHDEMNGLLKINGKKSAAGIASGIARRRGNPDKGKPVTKADVNEALDAKKTTFGTSMNADFEMPMEWMDICKQLRPDIDPISTFEVFRDYWAAQVTRKASWLSAWKYWVRKERLAPQEQAKVDARSKKRAAGMSEQDINRQEAVLKKVKDRLFRFDSDEDADSDFINGSVVSVKEMGRINAFKT